MNSPFVHVAVRIGDEGDQERLQAAAVVNARGAGGVHQNAAAVVAGNPQRHIPGNPGRAVEVVGNIKNLYSELALKNEQRLAQDVLYLQP